MPERNLVVVNNRLVIRQILGLCIAFAIVANCGCTKLAGTGYLSNNFVDHTNDLAWPADQENESDEGEFDSAAKYIAKAQTKTDSEQKDLARIIAESEEIAQSTESTIRLVAKPENTNASLPRANLIREGVPTSDGALSPIPTLSAIQGDLPQPQSTAQISVDCDHGAGCDCHKPIPIPKLAKVEPIEYPGNPSQLETHSVPPTAVMSQPLKPLMFNEATRQVDFSGQTTEQNGLRQFASATPLVPQMEVAQESTDSAVPTDFAPPSTSKEMENTVTLPEFKLTPVQSIKTVKQAVPEMQLNVRAEPKPPFVQSDPVVIVATVSPDEAPPFAEPPMHEPVALVAENNLEAVDLEATPTPPPVIMPIDVTDSIVVETDAPVSDSSLSTTCPGCKNGTCSPDTCPMKCEKKTCPDSSCNNPNCKEEGCRDQDCKKCPDRQSAGSAASMEINGIYDPTVESDDLVEQIQNELVEAATDMHAPNLDFAPEVTALPATDDSLEAPQMNRLSKRIHVSESNEFTEETVEEAAAISGDQNFSPMEFSGIAPQTNFAPQPDFESQSNFEPQSDFASSSENVVTTSNLEEHPDEKFEQEQEVRIVREVEVIDNTISWDVQLENTIEEVKKRIGQATDANSRNGLEVNLRLLEVLKRQMHDVAEHQHSLTNQEKAYWQHQLDAINVMLGTGQHATDQAKHSTTMDTLSHLRKAVERLESIANLRVSNGTFCREIQGFGQFRPFGSNTFGPNQKLLVYCEVENYLSQPKILNFATRYHTQLRGSFVVYDEQGRAVQQAEYPAIDDVVRNRRRDFYMYFPIKLDHLKPGKYRMEILVEDLGNNKSAALDPLVFNVQ